MDETIVIPSPNLIHSSILRASQDGWLVYGGPSGSLCLLEPIPSDSVGAIDSKQRFKAHVYHKAHKRKIECVDISLQWPEKRNVVSSGFDKFVREWNIQQNKNKWTINYRHCHEEHRFRSVEIAGVCYGTKTTVVSVDSGGLICKWDLRSNIVKKYSDHLMNHRPVCLSASPHRALVVAIGTRQGAVFIIDISGHTEKVIHMIHSQDDEIYQVSWCPQRRVVVNEIKKRIEKEKVIAPEDDVFDLYKDHDGAEFRNKKYKPKSNTYLEGKAEYKDDFLVECEKTKAKILKNKKKNEESMEHLAKALDKAHVEEPNIGNWHEVQESSVIPQELTEIQELTEADQGSSQDTEEINEYNNLLATIGKYGSVRIWTETGELLASCTVLFNFNKGLQQNNRGLTLPTLHWFKANSLLIVGGRNHLFETNPLKIERGNKLHCRIVHSLHRRSLYLVSSNAPRVQTQEQIAEPGLSDNWVVWTVGQDRKIISYNMKEDKMIETFASCGAVLSDVKQCPSDDNKVAMAASDGSIRVWETHTTNEFGNQVASGVIHAYWQKVNYDILTLAWHPTESNLLAFSTSDATVGLLDTTKMFDKATNMFPGSFAEAVYSLCWGDKDNIYACGNGKLGVFCANKINQVAKSIPVIVEDQAWKINTVVWSPHGLVVGAEDGGVALLNRNTYNVIASISVFREKIYAIAWHPQQTTGSQEKSIYKDYIAVCSNDITNTIAVLKFENCGDGNECFTKIQKPLSGHEDSVYKVVWNPHRDAHLLSTSKDCKVRIWNVPKEECLAIFDGHSLPALSGMWCAQPRLEDKVLTCGIDSCLRLWDTKDYAIQTVGDIEEATATTSSNQANEEIIDVSETHRTSDQTKAGQRSFILPKLNNGFNKKSLLPVRIMLSHCIEESKNKATELKKQLIRYTARDLQQMKRVRFLKLFGTSSQINEMLDFEAENHAKLHQWGPYLMLQFYRGQVEDMIGFATKKSILDPYLLSLCPTFSNKLWRDASRLFVAQTRKMVNTKKTEDSTGDTYYGDSKFCIATRLLSTDDVMGCIETLMESDLFEEAYILSRLRQMDSVAEDVLRKWAHAKSTSGSLVMATILYLVCGDVSEASITLGRSTHSHDLKLAGLLANFSAT